MFLPIGDDVEKRTFPIAGVMLLIVNIGMYLFTMRLWLDAIPPPEPLPPSNPFGVKAPPPPPPPPPEVIFKDWIQFMQTWGLKPSDVLNDKPWTEKRYLTLFTHQFLHGDVMHVFGNMVVLWAFAWTLEQALGSIPFLLLYLTWGVAAGMAQACWTHFFMGTDTCLIGASGAISGMIGGYLVTFGPLAKIKTLVLWFHVITVDMPATLYVGIWVFFQLAGMEEAEKNKWQDPIAYMAHAGGFVTGLVMLLPFRARLKANFRFEDRTARLAEDRHLGKDTLTLKKEAIRARAAELNASDGPPTACPHCGADLAGVTPLGERLLRCPNDGCKRLVYWS